MQNSDGRLDHLDLRALRLLDSILDTRSVTRTAEALGMSQPAASRALDRLRRTLGDRLVVRGSSGAALTPRGHALRPAVADALYAIDLVFAPAVYVARPEDGDGSTFKKVRVSHPHGAEFWGLRCARQTWPRGSP